MEVIGHRRQLSHAARSRLHFAAAAEQVTDQAELLMKQGVPVDLGELNKLQDAKARALWSLHEKHRC